MSNDPSQASRIADLEADNKRLRRSLDECDGPGELRHRLRSTLAMLRTIIRRSAETERDFASYVEHVEDRLDALMRAQSAADERGTMLLYDLLIDELLHYGVANNESATISGPEVELQPRAGQVIAMALHELVVNAIEHGQLDGSAGRLAVTWNVTEGHPPWLTLLWTEPGGEARPSGAPNGFGTVVLTDMLSYELRADTTLAFEPDGLRCRIRIPLEPKVGRVSGSV